MRVVPHWGAKCEESLAYGSLAKAVPSRTIARENK